MCSRRHVRRHRCGQSVAPDVGESGRSDHVCSTWNSRPHRRGLRDGSHHVRGTGRVAETVFSGALPERWVRSAEFGTTLLHRRVGPSRSGPTESPMSAATEERPRGRPAVLRFAEPERGYGADLPSSDRGRRTAPPVSYVAHPVCSSDAVGGGRLGRRRSGWTRADQLPGTRIEPRMSVSGRCESTPSWTAATRPGAGRGRSHTLRVSASSRRWLCRDVPRGTGGIDAVSVVSDDRADGAVVLHWGSLTRAGPAWKMANGSSDVPSV